MSVIQSQKAAMARSRLVSGAGNQRHMLDRTQQYGSPEGVMTSVPWREVARSLYAGEIQTALRVQVCGWYCDNVIPDGAYRMELGIIALDFDQRSKAGGVFTDSLGRHHSIFNWCPLWTKEQNISN